MSDSGPGISDDKLPFIFDRFSKFEDPGNIFRGNGLGLAIAKGLANGLGGTVSVKTEQGKGAIFSLILPAKNEGRIEILSEVEYEIQKRTHFAGKHILLVEDEEVNIQYYKYLFETIGLEMTICTYGEEAIEKFEHGNAFDMVLMDIKLPGIDGFETTRKIKSINNKVPVIAQSAYAFDHERVLAREAGCEAYLTKPVQTEELIKILNRVRF